MEGSTSCEAAFEAGRAAWPEVQVERDEFVRKFAGVEIKSPADLYLAYACSIRTPGALDAFERAFLSKVDRFLSRMKPSSAFVEDVRQTVREKLFVGTDKTPPKIGEYGGRGSLEGWLRVVVMRVAVDLTRKRGEKLPPLDPIAQAKLDPELAFIKDRYQDEFKRAFEQALVSLSREHRQLLRLHFLEGLTLNELAGVYHAHPITMARRVAAVRRGILAETQKLLAGALNLSQHECESLIGLLRSRLDVSIATWLVADEGLPAG
jgi:RNA polymerase sigma-70 factor, ECF subfamily